MARPQRICFTERAFVAVLSETREKIETETGGIFLGYRSNTGDWYVVETLDPGENSVFQPAYFEYDDKYVTHLANKVARLYEQPMDILGLWHRHPGSLDRFSSTDDGTNGKFLETAPDGIVSALVNLDPKFRITMYYVSPRLEYSKVPVAVGDEYVPAHFRKYREIRSQTDILNELVRRRTERPRERPTPRASLQDVIQSVEELDYVGHWKKLGAALAPGEELEQLLVAAERDVGCLKKNGFEVELRRVSDAELELTVLSPAERRSAVICLFALRRAGRGDLLRLAVRYRDRCYAYHSGGIEQGLEHGKKEELRKRQWER